MHPASACWGYAGFRRYNVIISATTTHAGPATLKVAGFFCRVLRKQPVAAQNKRYRMTGTVWIFSDL
jgi:hypothetical protein